MSVQSAGLPSFVLQQLYGYGRTDIVAVDFFATRDSDGDPVLTAEDLFWAVWEPEAVRVTSLDPFQTEILMEEPVLALPDVVKEMFLDKLAMHEQAARVPYQPDVRPRHR